MSSFNEDGTEIWRLRQVIAARELDLKSCGLKDSVHSGVPSLPPVSIIDPGGKGRVIIVHEFCIVYTWLSSNQKEILLVMGNSPWEVGASSSR